MMMNTSGGNHEFDPEFGDKGNAHAETMRLREKNQRVLKLLFSLCKFCSFIYLFVKNHFLVLTRGVHPVEPVFFCARVQNQAGEASGGGAHMGSSHSEVDAISASSAMPAPAWSNERVYVCFF